MWIYIPNGNKNDENNIIYKRKKFYFGNNIR